MFKKKFMIVSFIAALSGTAALANSPEKWTKNFPIDTESFVVIGEGEGHNLADAYIEAIKSGEMRAETLIRQSAEIQYAALNSQAQGTLKYKKTTLMDTIAHGLLDQRSESKMDYSAPSQPNESFKVWVQYQVKKNLVQGTIKRFLAAELETASH